VTITELLPGEFRFSVESDRYARWWCEESPRDWERKAIDDRRPAGSGTSTG